MLDAGNSLICTYNDKVVATVRVRITVRVRAEFEIYVRFRVNLFVFQRKIIKN